MYASAQQEQRDGRREAAPPEVRVVRRRDVIQDEPEFGNESRERRKVCWLEVDDLGKRGWGFPAVITVVEDEGDDCRVQLTSEFSVISLISMAQLIVRNISDRVVEALKRRAAEHGRSAEAEHRALLEATLLRKGGPSLKKHLLAIPELGEDEDFAIRRDRTRRVDL